MDDGDNFNKFICIILDCINSDDKICSYSNSKFYLKDLVAGDNLYSTFTDEEYHRDKKSLNIVIDNLLKYQKYFNIQSLPKYKITGDKIDLQITIPNIFNCIRESFDVENWYYDRIRNRKEENDKKYVNYLSKGMITNKKLMNRTFFGGDHASDLTIANNIILNTKYYSSYDLLLVNVLINFCYILNDDYYLSPNTLTMFVLSKIHYLIGKYYVINCNYYKTIKQLDNKILNLFEINDSKSNYLSYYQNDISQFFNFKFAYTEMDNYMSRMLILNNVLFYLPNIINIIEQIPNDYTNTIIKIYNDVLIFIISKKQQKEIADKQLILKEYVLINLLINISIHTLTTAKWKKPTKAAKEAATAAAVAKKAAVAVTKAAKEAATAAEEAAEAAKAAAEARVKAADAAEAAKAAAEARVKAADAARAARAAQVKAAEAAEKLIEKILTIIDNIKDNTLKISIKNQATNIKNAIDDNDATLDNTKEYANNINESITTAIKTIKNNILTTLKDNTIKYVHEILKIYDKVEDYDIDSMKRFFNNNKPMIKSFKDFLIDNKYVISVGSIDTLFNKLQNDPFTNPITLDEYNVLQKGNVMFMSAVFKTIEKNLKANYYYPIKFKSIVPRYTPYPVIPTKIANKDLLEKYDISYLMNQHIIDQFFKVNTLKQIPKFKTIIKKSGGSSDINIYCQMLHNIINKLKLKNISINEYDITAFNNKMNKIETIKNELQEIVNEVLKIIDKDKINEYNNKLTEYNKENHNIIEFLNQLDQYVNE